MNIQLLEPFSRRKPSSIGWDDGNSGAYLNNITNNVSKITPDAYTINDGSCYNQPGFIGQKTTSGSPNIKIFHFIDDADELVLFSSIHISSTKECIEDCLVSLGNDVTEISAGISKNNGIYYFSIYQGGVLSQLGTVPVKDGNNFYFLELYTNKTTGTVKLYVNEVLSATDSMSGSITFTRTYIGVHKTGSITPAFFSYIGVYDSSEPLGELMLTEQRTSSGTTEFTNANKVNTDTPSSNNYAESSTLNAKDLWNYKPLAVNQNNADTIIAVNQRAIASGSGTGGGTLSFRLNISSTDYDASVSSKLTSASMTEVQKTWYTNPNTGLAWTEGDLNTLKAGYVVA